MASTNKTTHYELSQYIGTDKPTYLTDYNQDMSRIDAGIYGAKSEADTNSANIGDISDLTTTAKNNVVSAINEIDGEVGSLSSTVANHTTAIGNNATAIGTLTNLSTVDKTDLVSAINEVDLISSNNSSSIGNLSNLDTTVKTDVVSAINEVDGDIKKFNFVNFDDYSSVATVTAGTITDIDLHVASNSDGSIAKIYGKVSVANSGAINGVLTIPSTRLRPESNITINGSLLKAAYVSSGINGLTTESFTVYTNGNITFPVTASQYATSTQYILINSVIFLKDFGDTPQN